MKKLKFFAFALAASALAFTFTACNNDDDTPVPPPALPPGEVMEDPPELTAPEADYVTIAIHVNTTAACNGMSVVGQGSPAGWSPGQSLNYQFTRVEGKNNWYVITLPLPADPEHPIRPLGITEAGTTDWEFNASAMEILEGPGEIVGSGYHADRELQFINLEGGTVVLAAITAWHVEPCAPPVVLDPTTDWTVQIHGSTISGGDAWEQADATFTSTENGTFVFTFTDVTMNGDGLAFGVRIMLEGGRQIGWFSRGSDPELIITGDETNFGEAGGGNVSVLETRTYAAITITFEWDVAEQEVTSATIYFPAP